MFYYPAHNGNKESRWPLEFEDEGPFQRRNVVPWRGSPFNLSFITWSLHCWSCLRKQTRPLTLFAQAAMGSRSHLNLIWLSIFTCKVTDYLTVKISITSVVRLLDISVKENIISFRRNRKFIIVFIWKLLT